MVHYRFATRNDIEPLLDLIEKGFSVHSDSVVDRKQGKEHRVLFSYLYSRENWNPEWVYLAEESGKLAAAVGFFPQQLFFAGVEIPVWAVSPVVTDPDFRGKGYAGTCIKRGLEELKERRIPAVFLWGIPKYYPRFGFVPVLPRYKTKLSPGKLTEKVEAQGSFRFVRLEDLPQIASIYNNGNATYWLQPKRDIKWWQDRFKEIGIKDAFLKEVPFPKKENFLVWENNKGEVKGYLNFLEEPGRKITVNESAASEPNIAIEMVASLADRILPENILYIRGTPFHIINNATYRLGGTHINPAPLAGMIKIIDWPKFVNFLLPALNERTRSIAGIKSGASLKAGLAGELNWVWHDSSGWEINTRNTLIPEQEKILTKLVIGFYDSIDLETLQVKNFDLIQRLFPKRYPFIWDNNYLY